MRNLKKFLALVMALVMAFSLMLTASAKDVVKDWTDKDQVTEEFTEAVDVLSGMEVFQGDEKGFRPGDTITRAEVAALIYRLATGDTGTEKMDLYTTTHPFTDVKADDWFAGYVGYCWNAGYIKGDTATTFRPYGQVTGYEVLAMVLRAMGYDANNEFTGSQWIVNVSATATQRGLLADVKSTHYANTLHLASRRDVVASILFQAAQKARVKYTPAFGYQSGDYNSVPGIGTGRYDDYSSLGWLNFGLTHYTGIVVDNQETSLNRKYTSLSIATDVDGNLDDSLPFVYDRDGRELYNNAGAYNTNKTGTYVNSNVILRLDVETGLNDFGHAFKMWFDGRDESWNDSTKPYEDITTHKTYAAYDKSTKAQMVYNIETGNNNVATLNGNTGSDDLGGVAKSVGFKVRAAVTTPDNVAGSRVRISNGYANFYKNGELHPNPFTADKGVYMLISNSDDSTLDVIVSLDVEATKITAVNNNVINTNKTIGVAWDETDTNFKGDNSVYANVTVNGTAAATASDPASFYIRQNKLTANSSITFQDYVIANALVDDSAAAIAASKVFGYNTKQAMTTKSGTVSSYHVNPAWSNADPDYVMLSDGTKIEKSPLYHVVPNATTAPTKIIPQVGNGVPAAEGYNNSEYEFILDEDGKYIGARPLTGSEFIYGTYVDYSQELSSSAFKYFITGVDKDGKVITKEVSKHNGVDINSVKLTNNVWYNSGNPTALHPVPFRDASNLGANSNNGIGEGAYQPFNVRNNDARYAGFMTGNSGVLCQGFANKVVIDSESKTLGAESAGNWNDASASNLYFTENTKFVLVEGFGTDSVKSEVYNGISELLGDGRQVEIDLTHATGHTPAIGTPGAAGDHYVDGLGYFAMTYMEKAKFIYEQTVNVSAEQATLVILPKAAVEFVGKSNLHYVGDPTATLHNAYGETATQFTMYDTEGNKVTKWIRGDSRVAGNDAYYVAVTGNNDKFYDLVDTGKKALDGEPVWAIQGGAAHLDAYDGNNRPTTMTITLADSYVANTYSAQNANITNDAGNAAMYNVGGAKVVNLSANGPSTKYPGISDLATLNNTSYVLGNTVRVSCVMDPTNNLIVSTIFVCYDQT